MGLWESWINKRTWINRTSVLSYCTLTSSFQRVWGHRIRQIRRSSVLAAPHRLRISTGSWPDLWSSGVRTRRTWPIQTTWVNILTEKINLKKKNINMTDDDLETSEDEEERRGQVSFSITANFQALQQKLMRELWSRSRSSSNRVRHSAEKWLVTSIHIIILLLGCCGQIQDTEIRGLSTGKRFIIVYQ